MKLKTYNSLFDMSLKFIIVVLHKLNESQFYRGVINMKGGENLEKVNVKPFKDSHIQYSINPNDYLKWLKNPELKEDLDKCLSEQPFIE